MCSLVTHTVQINPSIHIYLISDKIVLKCVKTHDSRIISWSGGGAGRPIYLWQLIFMLKQNLRQQNSYTTYIARDYNLSQTTVMLLVY